MTGTLFSAWALLILVAWHQPYSSYATEPQAGKSKEEYELQERCGKLADEVFRREYGNGIINTDDGQALASYKNHYNPKLNKCFVLLTYTDIPYKDKKKKASMNISLYDINENNEYGSFFKFDTDTKPFECRLLGKICHSKQEWDSLIKPNMED